MGLPRAGGIQLERFLSAKVLLAKSVGLALVLGAALPVGKAGGAVPGGLGEGPVGEGRSGGWVRCGRWGPVWEVDGWGGEGLGGSGRPSSASGGPLRAHCLLHERPPSATWRTEDLRAVEKCSSGVSSSKNPMGPHM